LDSSNYLLRLVAVGSRLLPSSVKQAIYRLPFLSSRIRTLLNRVSPVGLTEVIVASGPLVGKPLYLDLQSEKFYWLGTYEPHLAEMLLKVCKPGMIVYDVGANIGYHSLIFAYAVGKMGKVFAFEPLPANVERIRKHIALNKLEDILTVLPYAVADNCQPATFFVHQENTMGKLEGSIGRDNVYVKQITVESISLDELCFSRGYPLPNIVKIDIEGGAVRAIPGMAQVIAAAKPILLIELHGPQEAETVWDALNVNHYSVFRLTNPHTQITTYASLDWKEFLVAYPPE
jgi:FkbM family methyltransferase